MSPFGSPGNRTPQMFALLRLPPASVLSVWCCLQQVYSAISYILLLEGGFPHSSTVMILLPR